MSPAGHESLQALEEMLKTILPKQYQECYEEVQPVSMGSAGLQFDAEGKVAWDKIWSTFCDLAMAGGPPHKGKLLEPATESEIAAQPDRYNEVVDEICRGITLITDLAAMAAPDPGWIRVGCESRGMAVWLARAIAMENVSVRAEGATIDLPAGPAYRLEKEIKNVITSIAKTSHYWMDHMWTAQQRDIARLFSTLEAQSPLLQPEYPATNEPALAAARRSIAEGIERETGLTPAPHEYANWQGIECGSVNAAIWMMRALVTGNLLARREGTALFVPVNPTIDPDGAAAIAAVTRVHQLAQLRDLQLRLSQPITK